MTPEQESIEPQVDLGYWPDVDLVLVEDHRQKDVTGDEEVNRYFRIHMDIVVKSEDWDDVSKALRARNHKKLYDMLVPLGARARLAHKRGHLTLKAALGQ